MTCHLCSLNIYIVNVENIYGKFCGLIGAYMFITKIKLANLVTYIGMIMAILAIVFSYNKQMKVAFICFIVSGICDMFDGRFARMFKRTDREKEMGIQMDSLSDVISFIVVPVVLSLGLGLNKWYNIVIYLVYVVLGITRLGFFNVFAAENTKDEPIMVYPGVAVTYASLIFPIVYILSFFVSMNIFRIIFAIVMLELSMLFVLNIKVPKPRGLAYVVFSILAIIASVLIIIL